MARTPVWNWSEVPGTAKFSFTINKGRLHCCWENFNSALLQINDMVTWKDFINVQSSVLIPSPLLSTLTSLMARNRRKKLILNPPPPSSSDYMEKRKRIVILNNKQLLCNYAACEGSADLSGSILRWNPSPSTKMKWGDNSDYPEKVNQRSIDNN